MAHGTVERTGRERGVAERDTHAVAAHGKAADDLQREVSIFAGDCPGEREPEILHLHLDHITPTSLVTPAQARPGPAGEVGEVLGMTSCERRSLGRFS